MLQHAFAYLAVEIPFGIDRVVDCFCAELLRADRDDSVGVGLSDTQDTIHFHQLLSLNNTHSQNALQINNFVNLGLNYIVKDRNLRMALVFSRRWETRHQIT